MQEVNITKSVNKQDIYKDIRPYRDNEIKNAIKNLMNDKEFHYILNIIYPGVAPEKITKEISDIDTIYEFQKRYIVSYSDIIIKKTIDKFSYSGFENLDKNKPSIYISNHRDIILDSALLNQILFLNGFETTEIGVGSNLLIYNWIRNLVKVNKSFIVRRDLQGKEMLQESMRLSRYLRETITKRKTSIWIAQRQGRTKDGDDKTQMGLLKMLNFSGKSNWIENFKELNIIPVSISYEYEPCDKSKLYEQYVKAKGLEYQKTFEDDLNSMGRGIYNNKGNLHFTFGEPINKIIDEFAEIKHVNKGLNKLLEIIDEKIHIGYKLSALNYLAYDMLNENRFFSNKYNSDKESDFEKHIIETIKFVNGDDKTLRQLFLEMYSNPVKNRLKYTDKEELKEVN